MGITYSIARYEWGNKNIRSPLYERAMKLKKKIYKYILFSEYIDPPSLATDDDDGAADLDARGIAPFKLKSGPSFREPGSRGFIPGFQIRIRVLWSESDPVFEMRSDPDSIFKTCLNPVPITTSRIKIRAFF